MPIKHPCRRAYRCGDRPTLADITGPARIIDGDTIDIAGERIRLHGIDAPESGQTCVADGVTWPCGQSATAALP